MTHSLFSSSARLRTSSQRKLPVLQLHSPGGFGLFVRQVRQ